MGAADAAMDKAKEAVEIAEHKSEVKVDLLKTKAKAEAVEKARLKHETAESERKRILEATAGLEYEFVDLEQGSTGSVFMTAGFAVGGFAAAHLLRSPALGFITAVASSLSYMSMVPSAIRHKYRFIEFCDGPAVDMRADVISNIEMKHDDPKYALFEYSRTGAEARKIKVSLELLAQLTHANVIQVKGNDQIVAERIRYAAARVQTVNLNRYDLVFNNPVIQDTCLVAYAIYRQMKDAQEYCPFPLDPLPINPSTGYLLPMDTGTGKLSWIQSRLLKREPILRLVDPLMRPVADLFKSAPVAMSKVCLCLIPAVTTLVLWKRVFESDTPQKLLGLMMTSLLSLRSLLLSGLKRIWFLYPVIQTHPLKPGLLVPIIPSGESLNFVLSEPNWIKHHLLTVTF